MARSRTAFTLVELLVVVSVIAVLAATLLPTFGQARGKARQVSCSSNVRQLALAVLLYASDSDDVLPPVAYLSGPAMGGAAVLWPDLLQPYVRSTAVRRCPDDVHATRNSYGLNELAFADLTDPAGLAHPTVPLAAFTRPAETVMLGDIGTGDDLQTDRPDAYKMASPSYPLNDTGDARPSSRHFQRVDLGFMDGHQKPMTLSSFYQRQLPPDRWFAP